MDSEEASDLAKLDLSEAELVMEGSSLLHDVSRIDPKHVGSGGGGQLSETHETIVLSLADVELSNLWAWWEPDLSNLRAWWVPDLSNLWAWWVPDLTN